MIARILPYFLFGLAVSLKDRFLPDPVWGAVLPYGAAAAALLYFRKSYTELRFPRLSFREIVIAMAVGTVGIIIWVAPYHFFPDLHRIDGFFGLLGGPRNAVLPTRSGSPHGWTAYVAARSIGYILVTPVFEELFIRSFLFRYLIRPQFTSVPFGAYTHPAFWVSSAFFALTHPEWIVAFIYSTLLNLLLVRRGIFSSCVIAHATSNAILVVFVLLTGEWMLW